jgi:hypothetical protein
LIFLPISPSDLLQIIFQQKQSLLLFVAIRDLLENFGERLISFTEYFQFILKNCACWICDGLFDLQEDAIFVLSSIEPLAKSFSHSVFEFLFDFNPETVEEMCSLSLAAFILIEYLKKPFLKSPKIVISFIQTNISSSVPLLQQVSVMTIGEIGSLLTQTQESVASDLLETLCSVIQTEYFIEESLTSISQILRVIRVGSISDKIACLLVDLISQKLYIRDCIYSLACLVSSSGPSIIKFSDSLFPILSSATDDPYLRADAIEALGSFVLVCDFPDITDLLNLFINSAISDDLDVRSASILALANTLKSNQIIPEVFLLQIRSLLEHFLSSALDEECSLFFICFLEILLILLRMYISKTYDYNNLIENVYPFLDHLSEDIKISATLALTSFFEAGHPDFLPFIEILFKQLDSEETSLIAATFKSFRKLSEKNLLSDEYLVALMSIDFQNIFEYNDDDLNLQIFKFLSYISTSRFSLFPLTEVINLFSNKLDSYLQSLLIGLFRQIYQKLSFFSFFSSACSSQKHLSTKY